MFDALEQHDFAEGGDRDALVLVLDLDFLDGHHSVVAVVEGAKNSAVLADPQLRLDLEPLDFPRFHLLTLRPRARN